MSGAFDSVYERVMSEARRSDPDSAYVFDIDDTVLRTSSVVRVLGPDGSTAMELTPAEYNSFRDRPDSGDYDLDFSDFDRLDASVSPKPIMYTLRILKNIIGHSRQGNIYVLTARRAVVRRDIIDRFAELDVRLKPENVFTVGDASLRGGTTIADEKARVLRMLRGRHTGEVTFFDDDDENIRIARTIEVGGKRIRARKISRFVR